jgi:tetratricopeptide (TPR) repeat protein
MQPLMKNRFATRNQARIAGPMLRGLVGIVCSLLAPAASAATPCNAPPALKARQAARPSAQAYVDTGNWFADQKLFSCAVDDFAQAAKLQPQSASIAYLWGLSLYSAGHDEAALVPLHRAAKLDPSDIRPHLALGAALDRLKRPSDAEVEWRAALAIDADSSTALDSLTQDLIARKDYASVVALLEKPVTNGERSPQQNLNLGLAYVGQARLGDAARVLREALNTAPDSLQIADELALVLMLLGREHEAYAVFDLALQKHPDDRPTQVLYLRAMVSSHSEKAAQYAQQLLAAMPGNWEILYLNGVLASNDGNLQQARAYFERSIALHADYGPAHTALGNTLSSLGDLRGAKEQLERGIALGDDPPDSEYALARILRSLGETGEAQKRLLRYQQMKNAQTGVTQAAGKAESADQAMAAGNFTQAAATYRDAIASDPDEPLLHYKLSKALDRLHDDAGEEAELQQAIRLDPNLAEAQNQLGYLAARGGDPARAETFFRAAVQASPSYVVAWVNLAATLASEEKWTEAKQAVDRALTIDPDNAAARQLNQAVMARQSGP